MGRKILKTIKKAGKNALIEALTGVAILFLVSFVPVLGGIIKALVGLWGLGAVALTRFGTQKA